MEQLSEAAKLNILSKLLESSFLQALDEMERRGEVGESNHHERPAV